MIIDKYPLKLKHEKRMLKIIQFFSKISKFKNNKTIIQHTV